MFLRHHPLKKRGWPWPLQPLSTRGFAIALIGAIIQHPRLISLPKRFTR